MRFVYLTACAAGVVLCVCGSQAQGQLTSPQVGWQAELSTLAHNVSGTVTIVDEDTLRVDDFTYDGGGLSVYFYLAEENVYASFTQGLAVGSELLGMSFDGTQPAIFLDLPGGETLEGYHGVAVWCVAVNANFGSGEFEPLPEPGFAIFLLTGLTMWPLRRRDPR